MLKKMILITAATAAICYLFVQFCDTCHEKAEQERAVMQKEFKDKMAEKAAKLEA